MITSSAGNRNENDKGSGEKCQNRMQAHGEQPHGAERSDVSPRHQLHRVLLSFVQRKGEFFFQILYSSSICFISSSAVEAAAALALMVAAEAEAAAEAADGGAERRRSKCARAADVCECCAKG